MRNNLSEYTVYEVAAIQRDINARYGSKVVEVDGILGNATMGALEAIHGVFDRRTNMVNLPELSRISQSERNKLSLSYSSELVKSYSETSQIDALFSQLESGDRDASIADELALLTDIADGEWTQENKVKRRLLAQYITDKAAILVDKAVLSPVQASTITLRILSQEKFTSFPTEKQLRKML